MSTWTSSLRLKGGVLGAGVCLVALACPAERLGGGRHADAGARRPATDVPGVDRQDRGQHDHARRPPGRTGRCGSRAGRSDCPMPRSPQRRPRRRRLRRRSRRRSLRPIPRRERRRRRPPGAPRLRRARRAGEHARARPGPPLARTFTPPRAAPKPKPKQRPKPQRKTVVTTVKTGGDRLPPPGPGTPSGSVCRSAALAPHAPGDDGMKRRAARRRGAPPRGRGRRQPPPRHRGP